MDTFPLICSHHGGKIPEVSFPKRMTHNKSPPPVEGTAAGKTDQLELGHWASWQLRPPRSKGSLWKELRELYVPAFDLPSAEYVLSLKRWRPHHKLSNHATLVPPHSLHTSYTTAAFSHGPPKTTALWQDIPPSFSNGCHQLLIHPRSWGPGKANLKICS